MSRDSPYALHRYGKKDSRDYFYTADEAKGSRAFSKFNHIPEGICCYIATTQLPGTTALFRLVSPESALHYYTTEVTDRDLMQYYRGYELEGIGGYVWQEQARLPAQ